MIMESNIQICIGHILCKSTHLNNVHYNLIRWLIYIHISINNL